MKLLLDLGNTRLKWACWDGQRLGPTTALDHRGADFEARLQQALAMLPAPSTVALASVAGGDHGARIEDLLTQRFGRLDRVGPPHSLPELQLAYPQPETLGVDRWLGMLGALGADSLVVSCGSALTIDLLDRHGRHHGGLIAPSPERMREALLGRAPHLATAPGRCVEFADCTADAVASGALLAAVALIERQASIAAERLGAAPRLVLTGGGCAALAPQLRLPLELRDQLVFEGMVRLSEVFRGVRRRALRRMR
jgi:type III pantothenate kinase